MAGKVIHGVNAVREALRAGRCMNRLYVARESRAHGVAELLDEAKAAHVPFDFVPQAKLNELAETREHQGLVATISPVAYADLGECLARCPKQAIILALDQVQHPRNLGMLLRTALGAGVAGVIVPERGGALLDEDVVRASAGAVFHIPVIPCGNLAQTLRKLKDEGFWVYAMAAEGAQDVFSLDWADRSVLVMGNETTGIRPGVQKACDVAVKIPLCGGLDSLNVSVAAGVALFQAMATLHARQA